MKSMTTRKNFTRCSASIPRRLIGERAFHLLPVYYLLSLSDLGREGIQHSGSFRFADHIYAGAPGGRTALGRWIDAALLATPAAQAFRRRYQRAQIAVRDALQAARSHDSPLRVLAVPCGLPRDIVELAGALDREDCRLSKRIEYHGMDIDPVAIHFADRMTRHSPLGAAMYHRGNALAAGDYPRVPFHVVVSTGLGEFLDDEELATFYSCVYGVLEPGGIFYTSATDKDRRSDTLLRLAEIVTHYRTAADLERALGQLPWSRVRIERDTTGLQAFATTVK